MITEKDVENIAGLARLELSVEEKKKFQKDLEAILGFVDKLKELKVEGVEPTMAGIEVSNVMRKDELYSSYNPEVVNKMLAQSPDKKDNFVKVKSILNKN